jgi:polysaccharide export outer membrane protein
MSYFNDIQGLSGSDTTHNLPLLKVGPGDILQITVSTLDKDITQLYNAPSYSTTSPQVNEPPGYLVDPGGNVTLPVAGRIYVKGMTLDEVNTAVTKQVSQTLKNPYVSTRLLNFRVSVLGDVARPGSYTIPNARASILDALSLAGDANATAQRTNITLIREADGVKQFINLDLSDSKVFASPYYYLKSNDVVYVRPGSNKSFATSKGVILLPTIIAAISLVTTLIIISHNS